MAYNRLEEKSLEGGSFRRFSGNGRAVESGTVFSINSVGPLNGVVESNSSSVKSLQRSREELFEALQNLKQLKTFNLIREEDYENRRKQLVDSLTGTTLESQRHNQIRRSSTPASKNDFKSQTVVVRKYLPPPSIYVPTNHQESENKSPSQMRSSKSNYLGLAPMATRSSQGSSKMDGLEVLNSPDSLHVQVTETAPSSTAEVISKNLTGSSVKIEDVDDSNVSLLCDSSSGNLDQQNEITKSMHSEASIKAMRKKELDANDPWLNARSPPDFSNFPSERAFKYILEESSGNWVRCEVRVKIDPEFFAKGSLRLAYHCLELDLDDDSGKLCVAKVAIDPDEEREAYFRDVWVQMYAYQFAEKYNSYNPPKKIEFVKPWVLELVDRVGSPLCGVERYIPGEYRKHNNNYGYVSEDERNTPQVFSHFTYEASQHKILICDIQGVNDRYTDPQVHSVDDPISFGKGNMGLNGLNKFLDTHRCNAICRYLKLPCINARSQCEDGTMPETVYMSFKSVEYVNVKNTLPSRPHHQISSKTNVGLPKRSSDTKRNLFLCCVIL